MLGRLANLQNTYVLSTGLEATVRMASDEAFHTRMALPVPVLVSRGLVVGIGGARRRASIGAAGWLGVAPADAVWVKSTHRLQSPPPAPRRGCSNL